MAMKTKAARFIVYSAAARADEGRAGAGMNLLGVSDVVMEVTINAVQLSVRALDASPANLRPQPTSFIGCESEVVEAQATVKAHRLITLTGWVGKTRLALEVAAHLTDEFPDGMGFRLAAVTDPAAPDVVAAVLGITQQPGNTLRPPPWRAGSGWWCSTTASMCLMRPLI